MEINIGTDCSGIEAPIEALKKIKKKYGIDFNHIFSSETNKYAIDCIKKHNNPKIFPSIPNPIMRDSDNAKNSNL